MSTTLKKVFPNLRGKLDQPLFLHAELPGLGNGSFEATIFDWDNLDEDNAGMLVDSHLLQLASELGKGWSAKMAPFAILGGESHPVPLDELDQQCDGVLLLDLAHGKGADCPVLFCSGGGRAMPILIEDSVGKLKIIREK